KKMISTYFGVTDVSSCRSPKYVEIIFFARSMGSCFSFLPRFWRAHCTDTSNCLCQLLGFVVIHFARLAVEIFFSRSIGACFSFLPRFWRAHFTDTSNCLCQLLGFVVINLSSSEFR